MRLKRVTLLLFLPVFTFLALFLLMFGYFSRAVSTPFPGFQRTVEFIVHPGENVDQIGKRLEELGVIESSLIFRGYLFLNSSLANSIQAGEYLLEQPLSVKEIVELFQQGRFDVKFTLPEGLRLEEICQRLSQNSKVNFSPEEIFVAASNIDFSFAFLKDLPPKTNLEGFLFPDTYIVPKDSEPREVVDIMLTNFEKKFNQDFLRATSEKGLSLYETVTLASIVEREVKFSSDRPLVAGILLKRLENGWALEADATVQYAKANLYCNLEYECNWWPQEITQEDLEIDSLYNTRKNPGLPPGPICNPGIESLKAVLNPQESPYWYYLSDNEGKIHYSKTLEEHNQKRIIYLY